VSLPDHLGRLGLCTPAGMLAHGLALLDGFGHDLLRHVHD